MKLKQLEMALQDVDVFETPKVFFAFDPYKSISISKLMINLHFESDPSGTISNDPASSRMRSP
jgi:hypothetical protein